MSTLKGIRPIEPLDWVLVANAARARVFERDPENNAMRELASFVHPQSRLKGQALDRDRPGKAHKGVASTAFPPHTDPHQKEHAEFGRELAERLEEAALAHRYPRLTILASNPFLGELKAQLGAATQKLLQAAVALDLTPHDGAELEHRVAQALQAAG
ncbi:MAG: host attachment protein, partial [Rubrivivax sp.]|nr:host attachment protein [Rubrivivax sp.]